MNPILCMKEYPHDEVPIRYEVPMAIDQAYTAATPDPIAGFGPAVAGSGAQGWFYCVHHQKLWFPSKNAGIWCYNGKKTEIWAVLPNKPLSSGAS